MNNAVSKRATLFITSLAAFITPFMGSSINIALPSIGKEFSIDPVLLGWVATSHLLASAMFLVPFGKIADVYGRRKIFVYGMAAYTLSSFLAAFSPSAALLICYRILQGAGSAMIIGTCIAILNSVIPVEERGRALGINVAAVYTGLSLGPFFGGILTQHLGWRSIFLVNVVLGLTSVLMSVWKLKGEWAEARGDRFDFTGSILYGISLAVLMYGFTRIPSLIGAVLTLAGVSGLLLFVRWEMKFESPLLNMNLFRNNMVFSFSNLAAFINYSATFAVTFLLSLYLQYIKGLTPQQAGLVMVAQPVVQAVFSPIAGRLSDRIEPRIVASAGMALTAVGLLLFIFLSENTSLNDIVGILVILGFGFALFASPNTNAIMSSVEKRYYGVAASTLGTMRLVGQMLSMGIAMLIITLYVGRVKITPHSYPLFIRSMETALVVFSVLCFGGIFASLVRGKVR